MAKVTLFARNFMPSPASFHVARHRRQSGAVGEHTHQGYLEYFFLIDGRLRHRFNGDDLVLEPGTLAWIREHDSHSLGRVGARSAHLINVAFTVKAATEAARWLNVAPMAEACRGPGALRHKRLHGAARRGFTEKLENACAAFPAHDRLLRVLLVEVLAELFPFTERA